MPSTRWPAVVEFYQYQQKQQHPSCCQALKISENRDKLIYGPSSK